MKILVISTYIFGYIDIAVEEMRRQGHQVEVFYFENETLSFEYNNALHKVTSGIGKLFGKNAKKKAREIALKSILADRNYDFSLIIHGQHLNQETHHFLKSKSSRYVAYFFDSLSKMAEQKKISPYFDKVFSYEPIDCQQEGYHFITNFIPSTDYKSDEFKYVVFNIGGIDARFAYTKAMAEYLNQQNISFRFMLFDQKEYQHFEQVKEKLSVPEVLPILKDCKIMLDLQRENQNGLTFRVFEAIGNHKKLITTNRDIKNYPFYHPNNIYILDLENIFIPNEFFEDNYQPISQDIVDQYTIKSWVEKILA